MHAAFRFATNYPHLTNQWIGNSEYICILEIENETALYNLWEKSKQKDIPTACFIEPDYDNSLTAVALSPGQESKKLCSNLKLALKE